MHTLESSPPATASTAEERVAMVWPITCDVWALSGREMPTYERKDMPVRVLNLEDVDTGHTVFAGQTPAATGG